MLLRLFAFITLVLAFSLSAFSQAPCGFSSQYPLVQDARDFVVNPAMTGGNPDASITVVEFFDPNCSHCRDAHPTFLQLENEYGNDAFFVFVPFPLWDYSINQIEALHIAAEQGFFSEMMEAQFRRQRSGGLYDADLVDIAKNVGMDVDSFAEDLKNHRYLSAVQKQERKATSVGVTGTPRIWINGQTVANRSYECMAQLIEFSKEN